MRSLAESSKAALLQASADCRGLSGNPAENSTPQGLADDACHSTQHGEEVLSQVDSANQPVAVDFLCTVSQPTSDDEKLQRKDDVTQMGPAVPAAGNVQPSSAVAVHISPVYDDVCYATGISSSVAPVVERLWPQSRAALRTIPWSCSKVRMDSPVVGAAAPGARERERGRWGAIQHWMHPCLMASTDTHAA